MTRAWILVLVVLGLVCAGCARKGESYREKTILSKGPYRLVERTYTAKQPNFVERRLICEGREVPIVWQRLAGLVNAAYGDRSKEEQARAFVELLNVEENAILDSFSSIDGFSTEQLDPDFRNLDGKPVRYEADNTTTCIVYTYQRLGGVINRYKFEFEKGKMWSCQSFVQIASKAGKPTYRE